MRTLLVVCLAAILTTGCASTRSASSWPRTGDPITDGKAAIAQGPPRDKVLWEYRTAAAAMRRGQYDVARELLDDALARLAGIYGPDKPAKHARSYFSEEAKKAFLGEPYERVMALYYRGIVYWMDGEPDNARACFRSAQFHDSDAENREYASDYVLLDYLDGLATTKLGGDGSDALRRARELSKTNALPDFDREANVMFFCEFGQGPTKYATGQYSEQLRFREGHSAASAAVIRVDQSTARAVAYDNLSFQATTRGGRVMDHILANKAVFKSAADTIGDVAVISGAVLATQGGRNNAADEVGLGLLAFGLVSKIFAAATTPDADTRTWENLPQFLGFAALRLTPGLHTAAVEFVDAAGSPIAGSTKTININIADPTRDTVIFISDKNQ